MIGKIRVDVLGYKEWINNTISKLSPSTVQEMMNVMTAIKSKAQIKYLRGPYPERLRIDGGHLLQNIQPMVEIKFSEIIGYLTVASTAYYGLIWEAVGRYAHRKGMMFSGNDTPMCRPFALPAYKDLADWTSEQFIHSVVESSR